VARGGVPLLQRRIGILSEAPELNPSLRRKTGHVYISTHTRVRRGIVIARASRRGLRRRCRATADSKHALPIAPNVVARKFYALAPNRAWGVAP
jgi:putative transposase